MHDEVNRGGHGQRKRPQSPSILFDEIYLVGILVLTWTLFRLITISFLVLFDNACVPSSMIAFGIDYMGVFWFMVAADVFALVWITFYAINTIRTRKDRIVRFTFVAVVLVFALGNLSYLPMLFEWREVERDPRASFNLLHEEKIKEWPLSSEPPAEIISSRWESCTPFGGLQFKHDAWAARDDHHFDFWRLYEERTSDGMQAALDATEDRLLENREDGEAWAMKALVYANAVDFMAMSPAEASVTKRYALEKALAFAPDEFITHAAYGLIRKREDRHGAEARLKRCVAEANVRPHHRRASPPVLRECHNLYGDLLRKTGRAEQAGDIYLEGLERWPDNGELHVSYALYLQETGRASEAIEYLRKLVSEQPRFPRGRWHLALMWYEEGGDLDEAREHAVKALEMDPKIWNGEKLLLKLRQFQE